MNIIRAYLVDPIYGKESDSTADRKEMEREYGVPFELEDIAPGYSLPAFVTWVVTDGWPYLVAAYAAFLSGQPIRDNLDAWRDLAARLKNVFKGKPPILDRNGAAVVAVDAVLTHGGEVPIRLLGYAVSDQRYSDDSDPLDLSGFAKEPDANYLGVVTHVFKVEAGATIFVVEVDGAGIRVERL